MKTRWRICFSVSFFLLSVSTVEFVTNYFSKNQFLMITIPCIIFLIIFIASDIITTRRIKRRIAAELKQLDQLDIEPILPNSGRPPTVEYSPNRRSRHRPPPLMHRPPPPPPPLRCEYYDIEEKKEDYQVPTVRKIRD